MLEAKLYREKIYARYATVQAPQWLQAPSNDTRINQGAIAHRLRGWIPLARIAVCLDLGCGAGDLILALQSKGVSNVIGVDGGAEQVAVAKSRGVFAIQADIVQYLQTSDQSFDLIFAFDVIEHFTKDEVLELLGLIWKRLKPGGSLILQTPNAMSPWVSHIRYGDLTHETIFSPQCLGSTLRLSGFTGVTVREVRPYIHGFVSAIRSALWKAMWIGYVVVNCIESGSPNGGVYTRNMLVSALRDETAR